MAGKVLVANRGEIAVRIIRAARDLRLPTVAVYSDADRDALHVRLADEAVPIGRPEPLKSYLNADALVEAARKTGSTLVHPGYGFLSESAAFARQCRQAGLTFVGPPPEAMEALGDKVRARTLAAKLGVPLTPGSGPLKDSGRARAEAERIGYPVLLKAAAGGGGLGMRLARSGKDLDNEFEAAQDQALHAFGDGTLFLEKFHERPRHIEIQLLLWEGGGIHLGERECSIQRRYQKLIEEAPSPAIDAATREAMGADALKLATAAGYRSAGTAEFLHADGRYYFNEVNARLQVEHPVTEAVTGVDLVAAQLRIAQGEELPQFNATLRGHAIEFRINAEDPARNFQPAPGTITRWDVPTGPGIRVDAGVAAGSVVPPQYDSLLAKLIVHGPDRPATIARARRALAETRIDGVPTALSLYRMVLDDEAFQRGELHTGFLTERGLLERVVRVEAAQLRKRRAEIASLVAALHASRALYRVAVQRPVVSGGPAPWLEDDP